MLKNVSLIIVLEEEFAISYGKKGQKDYATSLPSLMELKVGK